VEAASRWGPGCSHLLPALLAKRQVLSVDSRNTLSQARELFFSIEQEVFAVCTPVYRTCLDSSTVASFGIAQETKALVRASRDWKWR